MASGNVFYCYSDELNQEYFKMDDVEAGYYPLGTILSIVWEWLDTELNIRAGIPTMYVEACLKNAVRSRYLEEGLQCYAALAEIYNHEKTVHATSLKNYLHYVEACFKNKDICNLTHLYQLTNMISIPLKTGERTWLVKKIGEYQVELNAEKIRDVLLTYNKPNKVFGDAEVQSIAKHETGRLINLGDSINEALAFIQKPERTYATTYKIESICDLMSAALQEIFSLRKPVRKCEYCGRLFVPEKSDTKYCSYLMLSGKRELCKDQAHREKVNRQEYKRPQCEKIFRNLRKMLHERAEKEKVDAQSKQKRGEILVLGKYQEKERDFLDRSKELRKLVDDGKIPIYNYYEFLCSYYKSDKVRKRRLQELLTQ